MYASHSTEPINRQYPHIYAQTMKNAKNISVDFNFTRIPFPSANRTFKCDWLYFTYCFVYHSLYNDLHFHKFGIFNPFFVVFVFFSLRFVECNLFENYCEFCSECVCFFMHTIYTHVLLDVTAPLKLGEIVCCVQRKTFDVISHSIVLTKKQKTKNE